MKSVEIGSRERRFNELLAPFMTVCVAERSIECLHSADRFELLRKTEEYCNLVDFLHGGLWGWEQALPFALHHFLDLSLGNPGFVAAWANTLRGAGILNGIPLPAGCSFFNEEDKEMLRLYEWTVLARYIEVFVASTAEPFGEIPATLRSPLRSKLLGRWKFARRWVLEYEATHRRRFLETRQERMLVIPTLGRIFGRKNRMKFLLRSDLNLPLFRRTYAPPS